MTDLSSVESYLPQIVAAPDLTALESLRIAALGKQGEVTVLLKTLGKMSPEERQARGPAIQALREAVTGAIADRRETLERAALDARLAAETLDMTLPVDAPPTGSVHPVSQVMDELAEIFADLGFAVATGPEIETDENNFDKLNIPASHPARAMHDTFYFEQNARTADGSAQSNPIDGGLAGVEARRMLLRTHTSPVQVRTMQAVADRTNGRGEPIRIIAPGRTYRSDSDSTHTPMFHQVEGLVIDRGITMGHLKWTLETFLRAYFERDDIVLRLRPSYFPFTEPSAEVDVGYTLTKGKRVIGGSDGWMEVLGSGMVHPRVIAACGLDPAEWQGFAFGCGIDRLAMLKYGMDDLRAFFDGDVRWLRHYGFSALDVPTLSGGISS
ncbi:phenylalanine--tRNA ligase subunit alpha [uncultured Sphingomonas sp.]|uniref:phenylalanine--tRNA ligase subunit alpha n=1 Tax=uncultured Sphingomonas sp. TaxID=158754 RepID=UPI0035CB4BBE